MKLTDTQITEAIYRVCLKDEPIKAVALDMGVREAVVARWVRKYEARK